VECALVECALAECVLVEWLLAECPPVECRCCPAREPCRLQHAPLEALQHFESHLPPSAGDASSGATGDRKTGDSTSNSNRLATETLRLIRTGLEAGVFTLPCFPF
jgi:hypothetical protein